MLRAFASVSKKDEELRELSVDANDNDQDERPRTGREQPLGEKAGGAGSSMAGRKAAMSTSSQQSAGAEA